MAYAFVKFKKPSKTAVVLIAGVTEPTLEKQESIGIIIINDGPTTSRRSQCSTTLINIRVLINPLPPTVRIYEHLILAQNC